MEAVCPIETLVKFFPIYSCEGYFDAHYSACNVKMIDTWWIWKDLEGGGRGIIDILSGSTSIGKAGGEIRSQDLQNTNICLSNAVLTCPMTEVSSRNRCPETVNRYMTTASCLSVCLSVCERAVGCMHTVFEAWLSSCPENSLPEIETDIPTVMPSGWTRCRLEFAHCYQLFRMC